MIEALQLWKKIAGKGDGSPNDGGNPESAVSSETSDLKKENFEERKSDPQVKEPSTSSSNTDLTTKAKPAGISEKAVVILEKEAPVLSDKELNPEFFQKHEKRGSDDLPVEVVVPRRCLNSSSSNNEEESEASAKDSKEGRTSIGNIPNDDSRQILMQVERLHVDMMNRLQLLKIILKDGPDTFDIPMEVKKGLLLNLYELPTYKDWEGVPIHELLLQLA
ncbi:microtubule-associated protein TORTIFOLIA1-like isoform X3 [Lotus japonicus]|uniref:microtubule-associated protein TORTIFOLIA1-like isoform X3 n=1 Tax=Lotus japonicus TaxID=34305 RepID=UPI002585ADCB|nr:microtubule-associated protein TORTIFOLIA1-like isoform X3 [Lotus japonicus]